MARGEAGRRRHLAALMALGLLAIPCPAWGGAGSAGIADVLVRTQDGRELRFARDLVRGRIVAINFIFTGCSTVCSLMGASFASVQTLLGDSAAQVSLLSVSIDPLGD